ncbi:MAG: mobile mystery protein B [Methylococcaceae bacterium]|nr:mobile mystery protein B [Methylococcaceae bacterium]
MQYPEGATPLDNDELEGLKFKHIQTRAELDQMEQVNIQKGLMWLDKQKQTDILNLQFIRKLHQRMFGEVWRWAGTFRQTEKNIGVDPLQISIRLQNLLDDVKAWIEFDTYPPKEAALRFHHRLVFIHLFANGNGRHARLMADALLKHEYSCLGINWTGHDLLHQGEHRKCYIKSLRQADAHDIQPLLSLFELKS